MDRPTVTTDAFSRITLHPAGPVPIQGAMATRVLLFGPPQILRDGAVVPVDTRKALAILAYLAVSGPVASRAEITALLWPDYDRSRGLRSLRRTLSALRGALDGADLEADRNSVKLGGDLDVDVTRFGVLASRGGRASLEQAAALVRGGFLAGFGLRDSIEFDDWQRREAERLQAATGRVFDSLAQLAREAGDLDAAIRHAERRLQLDPLSEASHRRLMELEAARGDRTAAVRRYRTLVRILDEELGVEPLAETTVAYEAIRAGRRVAGPTPATLVTTRPELPLVGRETEVDAVLGAIPRTADRGHLVLIAGRNGMGNSRLAAEVGARLRRAGALVAAVRCHEHESELGYAPVAALVRSLLATKPAGADDLPAHTRAVAATVVPELGLPAPAADRHHLLTALTDTLVSLAGGARPPVLVVDDAHLADPATRAYFSFLAHRLDSTPIALVATIHDDAVPGDDPLVRVAGDLERRGLATRVRLGPLSREDVEALGGSEELWRITDGVPLFVAEFLAPGAELTGVPDTLRTVLGSRLARVEEIQQQVLAAAAVVGTPGDAGLLRRVAGRSEEEVADALDRLTAVGLVARDADGRYSLPGAVVERVVYDAIGPERRRLLHRRAALELEAWPAGAAAAARHHHLAGDDTRAAALYARAGEAAGRIFANDEAISCYRLALDLGHPEAAGLLEAIADLETLAGRYQAARSRYELAAAITSGADLARLEHKLGSLHVRIGDGAAARSHLLSALAELDGSDPVALARVLTEIASVDARMGDLDEAERAVDRARHLAAGDRLTLATVENTAGLIAGRRGDDTSAVALLERSRHLAELEDDTPLRTAATNNLGLALARSGRRERATRLLEQALATAEQMGDLHRAASIHSNLADLLQAAGRRAAAEAHIRASAAMLAEIGEGLGGFTPEIWRTTEW